MVSTTVTVAEQVATLPLWSVTVSETGFAPTPAQVKASGATTISTIEQLSKEPLSISAGMIEALPAASR